MDPNEWMLGILDDGPCEDVSMSVSVSRFMLCRSEEPVLCLSGRAQRKTDLIVLHTGEA